jgi:hypothetical protein
LLLELELASAAPDDFGDDADKAINDGDEGLLLDGLSTTSVRRQICCDVCLVHDEGGGEERNPLTPPMPPPRNSLSKRKSREVVVKHPKSVRGKRRAPPPADRLLLLLVAVPLPVVVLGRFILSFQPDLFGCWIYSLPNSKPTSQKKQIITMVACGDNKR